MYVCLLGAQQEKELACLKALLYVAGLNVHLHHNYSVHLRAPRTQYEYDLQIPLRKMVDCRTRDLHQSLLVKLNRALVRQGKSGSNVLEGARSLRAFSHHPALEGPGTAKAFFWTSLTLFCQLGHHYLRVVMIT